MTGDAPTEPNTNTNPLTHWTISNHCSLYIKNSNHLSGSGQMTSHLYNNTFGNMHIPHAQASVILLLPTVDSS